MKVDPPKPITGRGTVDLGYGIYTGELKNGVPHGHGVIKYTQNIRLSAPKILWPIRVMNSKLISVTDV